MKRKKSRSKRYSALKHNGSAIDKVLKTVFIIGGTMQSGYTMEFASGNTGLGNTKNSLKGAEKIYQDSMTTELLVESLSENKRMWSGVAISISKDSEGQTFYDHIGMNFKGRYLPDDDYVTEELHKLKVKVVEKSNSMYLKSVFTIAIPQTDITEEQFDSLSSDFVNARLDRGIDDHDTCLMALRLKLTDNPEYVKMLKDAGVWEDLGKLIKAIILGF